MTIPLSLLSDLISVEQIMVNGMRKKPTEADEMRELENLLAMG